MNSKFLLPIILSIFLLMFVSGAKSMIYADLPDIDIPSIPMFPGQMLSFSALSEFLSEEHTSLNITISQNYSEINFFLDTEGLDWDRQNVTYEDIVIENIYISSLLEALNFKINLNDGYDYPIIESISIEDGSLSQFMLDMIFDELNYGFSVSDLNANASILTEFLKDYPIETMQGNAYLEKNGNIYTYWMDKGYGDVPDEYKDEIAEIIETAFYSMNIQDVLEEYFFPGAELDIDLDYDISVDLSDLEYENGNYEIIANIDSIQKIIPITLKDITFETETFIPEEEDTIQEIYGLKPGTILTFEVIESGVETPTLTPLRTFNITSNQNTSGTIVFRINKSEVTNPSKVSLYVWENSAWTKLATTLIATSDAYYEFSADIPHFSLFMVGEEKIIPSPPSDDEDEDDEDYRIPPKKSTNTTGFKTIPYKIPNEDKISNEPEPIEIGKKTPKTSILENLINNWGIIIILLIGIAGLIVLITINVKRKPIKNNILKDDILKDEQ